ncbi:MAG: sugar kinase [Acidimicrobiales bacterium]
MDVFCVGETLACLVAPGERLDAARTLVKTIGGSESNTAIGLARFGRQVTWVSRVGRDPLGDEILRTLRGEGVDVSRARQVDDGPTGVMIRERRSLEEIHVHYYRRGSAASFLDASDIPEDVVVGARRVHLTGITLGLGPGPRSAVQRILAISKANDIPVSLDPNFRRKVWADGDAAAACREVLPYVSDLLTNEDELLVLTGAADLDEAIVALEPNDLDAIVVKRGAAGVLGVWDGERCAVPAHEATVVDTVGAGDAFNAGYIYGRLVDASFADCLRAGAWVASRVVGHHGDWEGLPNRRELERWWNGERAVTR